MEIVIALIGLVFTILWYRFISQVGNAVLRIEQHLFVLIKQGTPSQVPQETLDQLKALRSDVVIHWRDAEAGKTESVQPRSVVPTAGEYFYSDEAGKLHGPHTEAQMRSFFRQGIVRDDTPVSEGGNAEWGSYSEVLASV